MMQADISSIQEYQAKVGLRYVSHLSGKRERVLMSSTTDFLSFGGTIKVTSSVAQINDTDELRIAERGISILHSPFTNRGSAFTLKEREVLGLTGLIPPRVTTIDLQSQRVYAQYQRKPDDLSKNIYLNGLRERNTVLFFRLLQDHLSEMLPVIYTPTVGTAIEQYSQEYRRPGGVYLSIDQPDQIEEAFKNCGLGSNDVDLIVATDSEQILGIGDWGVGGIDIAIGKLSVYTAAAGINPQRVIPVVLDVGTNRDSLLSDSGYLGNRHPRITGQQYYDFIDSYVKVAAKLFPNAILHWEDFGTSTGRTILDKYRDSHCTFNDDIQGTGAMVVAALLSAIRVTRTPLKDQRVVVFGSGSAGIGIADHIRNAMESAGVDPAISHRNFYCCGRKGLLTNDMGDALRDFQVPYAQPIGITDGWEGKSFLETVRRVRPTVLIGTSTVPGAFSKEVVKAMAANVERPAIFPLSNPTRLSEAMPEDLLNWTDGRALVATGSPFVPVEHDGITYHIAQANNALLFPGLGLGTIVAKSSRISDGMFAAASAALAGIVDVNAPGAPLLPSTANLRAASHTVAVAVVKAAEAEGLSRAIIYDVEKQVTDAMWRPVYPTVVPS
jgi:malate dehydrogenase (oxaloacetate-decarboxylating)